MKKKLTVITTSSVLALSLLLGCGKVSTVYYDAGVNYLLNNQFEEAEENFKTSLDTEAKTKDCYRLYGIALLNNSKYEEAVKALTDALLKNNGDICETDYDINYYLGTSYEKLGDYAAAEKVYSAIATVRPKDSESHFRRAICRLMLGDKTGADEDFLSVTSKDPSNIELYLKIFFAIKDAGFETDANSYLTAIVESDLKITDYDRGRIYYYLSDYSNARIYLEKAKTISSADTFLMLGKTYEAIGDYNYAASLYTEYLNSKGNNAAVYNQLGVCRSLAGDHEGALTAFQFGLRLEDPDWMKRLSYNEAVTYEKLLDFNTAYDKMTEYLAKYPKDENAQHELVFLETRKTEPQQEAPAE
ncbi:MAG: tetratricopeptide repeat protein [Lachnospiraceae bacterium]|nr:tetratricopeptide repeat protein [Lachnospiraceae bacterium]